MSELGLCSRREADEWIENGWVKVDGAVMSTLGTRVPPEAHIEIDPAARRHQGEQVTILVNKPIGYVSGQAEDGYQPASVLIRPENRWAEDRAPITFKPSHLRGLAPAGRLDIDSTGLIVFTQDGRVARRLIGRDSEVEKEYLVRVEGTLSPAGMQSLQHGLELDGVKLKPARVSWQNEHQLRFVLREGRKRQIRRMCELVGLAVTGLKRVRTGSVAWQAAGRKVRRRYLRLTKSSDGRMRRWPTARRTAGCVEGSSPSAIGRSSTRRRTCDERRDRSGGDPWSISMVQRRGVVAHALAPARSAPAVGSRMQIGDVLI
jgi:23S rRNA pseudouridine2604 synthase